MSTTTPRAPGASAPQGRDDIPVFDSDALDALGGLFDTLARGLDLADRLERVDGGGETAAYLRTLTLGFLAAVRASSRDASAPSAPSAPSDAPAPGAAPASGAPVVFAPGTIPPPQDGDVAYVYAARHVFGPNDAMTDPSSSGFACWVEDYFDPNNPDHRHLGYWAPPDAAPPGTRPAINTDTGRQWTAWEFVKAATESVFPIVADIDEDYVYRGGVWLPPEIFI